MPLHGALYLVLCVLQLLLRQVGAQAGGGASMTTTEEAQALRDTIATLSQRIADLESAQTLGTADRVILQPLGLRV